MKRLFPYSLFFVLILAVNLAGCGGGNSVDRGMPAGYTPGQAVTCTVGNNQSFALRYVPRASGFPIIDDSTKGSVANAFWMAETEVTYALWTAIYEWAINGSGATGAGQYHFQNAGRQGGDSNSSPDPVGTDQHPVTNVSWRDAIVWCNALTEYYNAHNMKNLACVYVYNGEIVRDSRDENRDIVDSITAIGIAKGFRLPTSVEWELAARYQDGVVWTPGSHAIGDTTGPCWTQDGSGVSSVFGNYAWFEDNSSGSTQSVGQKMPNALRIRDMSGNVWEWSYDWLLGEERLFSSLRGGAWSFGVKNISIQCYLGYMRFVTTSDVGFRFVKTQ